MRFGVYVACRGIHGMKSILFVLAVAFSPLAAPLLAPVNAAGKTRWKPVTFAIVKFNGEAPKSWNIYHTEKRGLLLVRLWKRYLLVNLLEQEVFDIDPQTVKPQGDGVEW